jgi:hypothetical protein
VMIPSPTLSCGRARLGAVLVSYLVAVLAIVAPAHAKQPPSPNDFAVIFGTVWGPDDRPVYGVTVKIRRAGDKHARWEVHSNHVGEFEQLVPAGKQTYILWAETKGLKARDGKHLQAQPVTVEVETNERVDTGVHLK